MGLTKNGFGLDRTPANKPSNGCHGLRTGDAAGRATSALLPG